MTNGDIDHLAGLLSLREGHRFTLFATQANLELIAANSVFRVLDRDCVAMKSLQEDISEELGYGLRAKPFFVPGKVPLHEETETIRLGEIGESTLGLEFECGGARVVHIPGCAKINDDVLGRASRAGLLLFDGTTFTDDEMVALGLSSKTAWRMGHMAISGAQGSLAAFAKSPAAKGPARRRIYTHINNTNPILIKGSPERRAVEADGWEVAYDGMEISL